MVKRARFLLINLLKIKTYFPKYETERLNLFYEEGVIFRFMHILRNTKKG